MKIIHTVLGKANPERMNGVNKVAHQLATTMKAEGQDVCLWGIANSLEHNYPERIYETFLFQQQKNKLGLDPELKKAIQALEKDTIVHFHGAFIPEFYHFAKALNKKKIPYLYTPHGSLTAGAMHKSSLKKKTYFRLFESYILKHAKKVQLLGQSEVDYLSTMIQANNLCMIPNGQIFPQGDWTKNSESEEPVFGFCGRLDTYHKGLDNLLDGFALYLKNGFEGKLEMIGDGKDRAALEKRASTLQIDRHITFHGAKFGDEKYKILKSIDMFMHPSRMEGFPTAVLEAAALEKPCISSDATNINAFIKKYSAGIPIDKSTPENVGTAMQIAYKIYRSGGLEHLGENALHMVESEFTWEKIAAKLVQEYEA